MAEKLNSENPTNQEASASEQRPETASRILSSEDIMPLHGKKIEDIFSSEESKRDFIANLTTDEFIELLNDTNGIMRGKDKGEWNMDGGVVLLHSPMMGNVHIPPRQEDKPELLAKVLDSAQEMSKDKRDMKDIALLISSSINAIHPYMDGNGRTSRLFYTLFSENIDDKTLSKLQDVLVENEGRFKLDINPGIIRNNIDDVIEREVASPNLDEDIKKVMEFSRFNIKFANDVSEDDKELFKNISKGDKTYYNFGILKYLRDYESDLTNRNTKDITQEEINKIIQSYREIKKRYVEILIDSIAHPEKEEYKVENNNEQITLKDYFELELKKAIANSTDIKTSKR